MLAFCATTRQRDNAGKMGYGRTRSRSTSSAWEPGQWVFGKAPPPRRPSRQIYLRYELGEHGSTADRGQGHGPAWIDIWSMEYLLTKLGTGSRAALSHRILLYKERRRSNRAPEPSKTSSPASVLPPRSTGRGVNDTHPANPSASPITVRRR